MRARSSAVQTTPRRPTTATRATATATVTRQHAHAPPQVRHAPQQQQQQQQQPAWQQQQQQLQGGAAAPALEPAARSRRALPTPTRVRAAPRPWSTYHARLLATLKQRQLLPRGARVLVAVSGGQDSMALLRLLHDLATQQHWPLQLTAAHCNHGVRSDAAESAAHVAAAAAALGLPFVQATAAARTQAGHWPEAAAREWRHSQLQRMAREAGCAFIALGHTQTDRAETMLLNLARGAGPGGLGAMGWSHTVSHKQQRQRQQQQQHGAHAATGSGEAAELVCVRPLLEFSRRDTLDVCRLTRTRCHVDSTNSDMRYARNRVRLAVLPQLEQVNSRVVAHMAAAAELLESAQELVADAAAEAAGRVLVPCCLSEACPHQPRAGQQVGQHEQQQQQQQQQQQHVMALDAGVLHVLPTAVAHQVVREWLHAHMWQCSRARQRGFVSLHMVLEVLWLACAASRCGVARTSSLWRGASVVLLEGVLLLLDDSCVRQLQQGQRVLQRMPVVGGADRRVAAWRAANKGRLHMLVRG